MKYLRESDPQDVFDVFAIDIRYPSVCLELYLRHYERSLSDSSPLAKKKRTTFQMEIERVATIIDQENGLTPFEIREIKTKQDSIVSKTKLRYQT